MRADIKNIIYATWIVLLLSMLSCTNEDLVKGGTYAGEKMAMRVNLGTKSTDPKGDDVIDKVRFIIFTEKNELVCNEVQESELIGNTYSATTKVARGRNDFYVICNETPELAEKLAAIASPEQIEQVEFEAAGVTPPVPMYYKITNTEVTADGFGKNVQIKTPDNVISGSLTINLTRMVARLSFTAIKNVTGDTDFIVEELIYRVCRMPKYSTIGPNTFCTTQDWAKEITVEGTGKLTQNQTYTISGDSYTLPEGAESITFDDIYIPEHVHENESDETRASYLYITAKCRLSDGTGKVVNSIYLLNLGEIPGYDYNIHRNNHYKIYATITGLGAMGLYADIKAFKQNDVTVNWAPIDGLVIVSERETDFDPVSGQSSNVNIWTDYNAYSGTLKTFHSDKGFTDILFKYGSVIGVKNDISSTTSLPFTATGTDMTDLGDIQWYPSGWNPLIVKSWQDVPYAATGDIPVDQSLVMDGLGDPCKLAGLSPRQIQEEGLRDNMQWHMATKAEYDLLLRADIADNEPNSYGYKAFRELLLPNVKYRDENGQLSASDNGEGKYWTTTDGSYFNFISNNVPSGAIKSSGNREHGYTVRCVRNKIPPSKMELNYPYPNFNYAGGSASMNIYSNLPYWKATLTGADKEEYKDEFSFAKDDFSVKSIYGSYDNILTMYAKRFESKDKRRFEINITGVGFDGVTHSYDIPITQRGYTLYATLSTTPILDKDHRVPKDGGTYSVHAKITPDDIAFAAGQKIAVVCKKSTATNIEISRSDELESLQNVFSYDFNITVPPNTTPDVIGLYFQLEIEGSSLLEYYNILQDNK